MLRRPLILIALLTFAALPTRAASNPFPFPPLTTKILARRLGGSEILEQVQTAPLVQASRVSEGRGLLSWRRNRLKTLAGPDAQAARALLLDPGLYSDASSECIFDPGYRLVFTDPAHGTVQFLFCFHCLDMEVNRGGERIGFITFDRGESRASRFFQHLFPWDGRILNQLLALHRPKGA